MGFTYQMPSFRFHVYEAADSLQIPIATNLIFLEAKNLCFVGDEAEEDIQYPFYTEGSKALLRARVEIAKCSILRVALRLQRARRKRDDPDEDLDAEIDWALKQAGSLVWSSRDFKPVKTLSGHEGRVTSLDIAGDGQYIATVSSDRTIKHWSSRNSAKEKDMKID
ncbi:hypothetical protein RHGRI_006449 [Rhododendron griersonianum]|uniref:Uncharacterized protein n=1 Tax=Rhododendron griersonianum TaxID=479676 RepID=A0AAV6KUI5_9ERIC|nr:hypothetical protein RHGRI_006449 [Rhododendron griersonianum]